MFGKKVKELREALKISQVELAERVGISQGAISQIEVGIRNCQPSTTIALARELKVSVEELAGESSIMITLMRNLQGLSLSQLSIINDVVVQFKRSPV